MAIGNYYPLSPSVVDEDLFLGTKSGGNNTVNYTAQTVSNYLNTNSKVAIGGQISFRFDISPNIPKTISFSGGGGSGTPFSSITQLIVSGIDLSSTDITIFLNYLNGSEILLAQQNQPNLFGNYKITSYTQVGTSNFYTLGLQFIGGNGTITENTYYNLSSFVLSSGIDIPTLNQVLTAGNTSLLDAKIGQLYLYDTTELDYGKIRLADSEFGFYDPFGNKIANVSSSGIVFTLGGNNAQLLATTLTSSRTYQLPNASGTIALISDIPIVNTPTLNQVLTAGNTSQIDLKAGKLYSYDTIAGDYGYLQFNDAETTIQAPFYVNPAFYSDGVGSVKFSNGIYTPMLNFAGVGSNVYTFQNANGTLAFTSDIPSLSGYVPTSRTLTINGTAYDLTADRSWSVGTVTSVGMTVPSAFSVTPSSITSSGTFAITGAGTVSQYVRGDGTLANFPTSTGGGSSFNYYLNGSISQGTFGGNTYYQMSRTPIFGAGTNFTRTNGAGNGYIASFITDVGDPNQLNIPGGNWNVEFYFNASSVGGSPSFYAELYKVSATNIFTLIASDSLNPEGITNGTTVDQYFTSIPVPQTSLLATDRLAVRIFVNTGGRTITLHTENGNLSEVLTTFSSGLTALNGLTQQVQYFAVGTSGTDFNISSATDTHTFNLPTASAANRGALSSADWTAFNSKFTLPSLTSGSVLFSNGTTIAQDNANLFWDDTNNSLGIGTNAPAASARLDITSTTQGFLPPRMTTTQRNAIASPVTGLIVYDTDLLSLYQYNGTAWVAVGAGGGSSKSINSVSTNTIAGSTASTDYFYFASGTINITLPTAVGNNNNYVIKNVGTGVITIDTTSSQTIDGSLTAPIKVQYLSLTLISDGANWNII